MTGHHLSLGGDGLSWSRQLCRTRLRLYESLECDHTRARVREYENAIIKRARLRAYDYRGREYENAIGREWREYENAIG